MATLVTSETYDFAPSLAEVVLNAYARIGVRRSEILQTHMVDARLEANLMLARIATSQPNLWTVDLQSVPLLEGYATYTVPAETVMILDAYVRYGSPTTDRVIYPISRTEYSTYPNKSQAGFPTVYWFDRLISPTITVWMVPDGNGPYTLFYYRVRQVQDSEFTDAQNIDIPYVWLDAFVAGLAHRLSRIYAPNMEAQRKVDADEAWKLAAGQDVENVSLMMSPGLSSYFR